MPIVTISKIASGVTPTGDFLVYLVKSDAAGHEPYRVDLQRFNGNGYCECPAFLLSKLVDFKDRKMTRKQALEAGALPNKTLCCKHILKAKWYIIHEVLNKIISDREKQANENKQKAKKARAVDAMLPQTSEAVGEYGWQDNEPLVG